MTINSLLQILDTYAGPAFALVFFGIIGYIFYWILVLAPKRIHVLFNKLRTKGYKAIDTSSTKLHEAIANLAPVYPIRPRKDHEIPQWTTINAVRYVDSQAIRFIAHVSRLQVDRPGITMKSTERKTILFFEERDLDIKGTFHLTPTNNPGDNLWQDRYQAKQITDNVDQKLLDCFDIYSSDQSSLSLPEEFVAALIEVCPSFCQKHLFCFQGGVNLIFKPGGWGFCPAKEVYTESDLAFLIDIFHKLHRALK